MKKATINTLKNLMVGLLLIVAVFGIGFLCVRMGKTYEDIFLILFCISLATAGLIVTGVLPYIINKIKK